MEATLKSVSDKAVATCPLCHGEWPDHNLREDGYIIANGRAHIFLAGVQLTIFRAAKRPGGVTMQSATELTGASPETIKVTVCLMNKHKLIRLGKKIVNANGRGFPDARYVLREVE